MYRIVFFITFLFFLETFLPASSILLLQSDLAPSSAGYIVSSWDFSVTLLSWILCFLGVLFSFSPGLLSHFSATFCPSQSPVVPRDSCCLRSLLLRSPLLHWIRAHLNWMQYKRWCVTCEAKSWRLSHCGSCLTLLDLSLAPWEGSYHVIEYPARDGEVVQIPLFPGLARGEWQRHQ